MTGPSPSQTKKKARSVGLAAQPNIFNNNIVILKRDKIFQKAF
jgi:hypothetical protein